MSPNAAEISLAAVERASQRFGDAIEVCERELRRTATKVLISRALAMRLRPMPMSSRTR